MQFFIGLPGAAEQARASPHGPEAFYFLFKVCVFQSPSPHLLIYFQTILSPRPLPVNGGRRFLLSCGEI
jgi:hypothetical protein